MQSQTQTDYTRDYNTEKILLFFIVETTIF